MDGPQDNELARIPAITSTEHINAPITKSCIELVAEFQAKGGIEKQGTVLTFNFPPRYQIYNPAPFIDLDGRLVVAARAEKIDRNPEDLYRRAVVFFEERGGSMTPTLDPVNWGHEDPFFALIGGRLMYGAIVPWKEKGIPGTFYRTDLFWRNRDGSFEKFFEGPKFVKGIRPTQLEDGRIASFVRLDRKIDDLWVRQVGFTVLDKLGDLTRERVLSTPIIEGLFSPGEWGGVNQATLLPNGCVEALGHIAYVDKGGNRPYYAMKFVIDPKTGSFVSPVEIIAVRKNFPKTRVKPGLSDEIYPGGKIQRPDGAEILFVGIGDAASGMLEL